MNEIKLLINVMAPGEGFSPIFASTESVKFPHDLHGYNVLVDLLEKGKA